MEWPRISVVTPSYNQGRYLEETIGSVLGQYYPALEYIVIDGGSNDESIEIIRKYEHELAYWTSEPDRGQSHAINKGFERATGDIYCYLNSDDKLATGVLFYVANKYREWESRNRGDEFWIALNQVVFDEREFHRFCLANAFRGLYSWVYGEAMIPQASVFWSAKLFKSVDGFDEELHYIFDKEFFLRLLLSGYRYEIDPFVVGSYFRIHGESKTTKDQNQFEKERNLVKDRVMQMETLPKELLNSIRHQRAIGALRRARDGEGSAWMEVLRSLRLEKRMIVDRLFWGTVKRIVVGK